MKAAYHAMNRLSSVVNAALVTLGGLLVALCFLALLFQVLYRFIIIKFFAFSFPFTEEFARYALIWSCYLCIAACLREGSQAAVNFLYDRLEGPPRLVLYLATRAIIWFFLVVAIYYGLVVVEENLIYRSATLELPGVYIFTAPVVGCVLMGYESLTEMLGVLSGELRPFEARPLAMDRVEEAEGADLGSIVDFGDMAPR